jgi:hypothetical protein
MRHIAVGSLLTMVVLAACGDEVVFIEDDGEPAAPRALDASYYAGAVTVTWELAPDWNNEPFRVYSRRVTDADFFFIAEVTSCIDGLCSYLDTNVVGGETYEYYVTAVSPSSGFETQSATTVDVFVPWFTPPPLPDATSVVALDNANFITWGTASREATDFSHYKVYQDLSGTSFLLGETDSEGFLDLLAANGETYSYFVTAVDSDGHESDGSVLGAGTPRPDFHGEWVYDFFDQPSMSGFRFAEDEGTYPIVGGLDPVRHFRFESDANGWWLVPNTAASTSVYPTGFQTTALKCGVAADAGCVDVSTAPASGYVAQDVQVFAQESYVLRVVGNDGEFHYGVIRIDLIGFDQNGDGIMIFDWAYQLQAGNPDLVSPGGS